MSAGSKSAAAGRRSGRAAVKTVPRPSPPPRLDEQAAGEEEGSEGAQDADPRESYERPATPREAVDEQGLAPGPAAPDPVADAAIERDLDDKAGEPDGSALPPYLWED